MANSISSTSGYDHSPGSRHTSQLAQIQALLTSSTVQSLLRLHPNELASGESKVPSEWLEWQSWSTSVPRRWLELVRYYMNDTRLSPGLPATLRNLLDEIREVQLPRKPIALDALPAMNEIGMSPKKAHEVSRMARYVLETIKVNRWDTAVLRIVDVGAGQGYLTRALKAQLPRVHILALDADEAQTIGAQRWETRLLPSPSEEYPPINHETIHITPQELFKTIDEWILGGPAEGEQRDIPVLLLGLHACGSLTPDIMRTFSQKSGDHKCWNFGGAVVVGCCYNLLNPGDFPLSKHMKGLCPFIDLPTSAYHLAAQIPNQWLTGLSPSIPAPSVELALRKVAWRALLGKKLKHLKAGTSPFNVLTEPVSINLAPGRQLPWSRLPAAKTQNLDSNDSEAGTGATAEMRRLGRLRDTAYQSWEMFLDVARKKMGVDFGSSNEVARDVELERLLEVVHTLRCIVGPLVESAIVLDRMAWLGEILCAEGRGDVQAEVVNLFDQATGSGRNIGIVIAPSIPSVR